MPDTKTGREKKGRNKQAQLEARLARRDVRALNGNEEPPRLDEFDEELLVEPDELDD
ncbi:hypothetical protein [Halegenticoccus tardaugens]|uniref:hypothetical protein n=1 Tax=Halegenticoccus tardaugens TaxID=2071624 RepID=UPI0013E97F75|nr:hypothetical protein [Halegenticoccus tardaugens]